MAGTGRTLPQLWLGLVLSAPVALRGVLGIPPAPEAGPLAHPLQALLALWAAASLLVVPVGLWSAGGRLARLDRMDRAVWLGASLASLPLALFGGVLKSVTHHRPLGGVTFGVAASAVLVLSVALAFRLGTSGAKATWLYRFFSACCWLSLGVTLALASRGPHIVVDFLVLAAACAGAGLLKTPSALERFPAWTAVVAWLLLLGSGSLLLQDARLAADLRARAPISFAALSWLGDGS